MIRLSVPDMSCGHCKASIEARLAPITSRLQIDLASRELVAEGASREDLLKALDDIGFPAVALD